MIAEHGESCPFLFLSFTGKFGANEFRSSFNIPSTRTLTRAVVRDVTRVT